MICSVLYFRFWISCYFDCKFVFLGLRWLWFWCCFCCLLFSFLRKWEIMYMIVLSLVYYNLNVMVMKRFLWIVNVRILLYFLFVVYKYVECKLFVGRLILILIWWVKYRLFNSYVFWENFKFLYFISCFYEFYEC